MSSEKPTIQSSKNGPYLVKGLEKFTNSSDEQIPTRATIALCRCGASKNKPFCDGSHDRIGFSDAKREGRVPDQRDTYKEQRAGEWPVWQTSLHNPNFAEYAQICGGHGVRVERVSELDNALTAAIAYDGPALVEVMSDGELI